DEMLANERLNDHDVSTHYRDVMHTLEKVFSIDPDHDRLGGNMESDGHGHFRDVFSIPNFRNYAVKVHMMRTNDSFNEHLQDVAEIMAHEGAIHDIFEKLPPRTFTPLLPILDDSQLPDGLRETLESHGFDLKTLMSTSNMVIVKRGYGVSLLDE